MVTLFWTVRASDLISISELGNFPFRHLYAIGQSTSHEPRGAISDRLADCIKMTEKDVVPKWVRFASNLAAQPEHMRRFKTCRKLTRKLTF